MARADFEQNENKDVHIRRAKDILSLMSSVTAGAEDEAVLLACKTLVCAKSDFVAGMVVSR